MNVSFPNERQQFLVMMSAKMINDHKFCWQKEQQEQLMKSHIRHSETLLASKGDTVLRTGL